MKTLVAISLSFLIFFQSVGFGIDDMFMLRDLTEHFKCHSEKYGDSVFDFFQKHYGSLQKEHSKEEDSHHENLPFQHHNCQHLVAEVILVAYEFPFKKSVVNTMAKPHFFYKDLYSFLENSPIFQPPQLA